MPHRIWSLRIAVPLAVACATLSAIGVARAQTVDTVYRWNPRGALFSFDHVLSIYEWRGIFDYTSYPGAAWQKPLGWLGPVTDIHLKGNSRFLPQDSLTTTDASGWVTAVQPLTAYRSDAWQLAPYVTFAGTSYVSSPRPGSFAASLITKQVSGFGIGGLQLTIPVRSAMISPNGLFFSAGAGLARQTQSAFGALSTTDLAAGPLSANGLMLASEDSAAPYIFGEGVVGSAYARLDERFFSERGQRFSDDSLRMALLSGTSDPHAAQNAAYAQLSLLRRDFFFSPDSVTSVKQERTEYSLAITDSLIYPVIEDYMRAHLALEFDPSDILRTSDLAASSIASSAFSTFTTLMAPSEVSSLRLATQAQLTLGEETPLPSVLSGDARMRYEERSETVRLTTAGLSGADQTVLTKLAETLDEASYSSRTTTAGATLHYIPDMRDEADIEGTARILQYDTPSESNDDDHDDLLTALQARYRRQFSPQLGWNASLRTSSDHLVYLKSDRSAQNAVTRSLVFGSNASLAVPEIFANAGGEVFANYTVFDYANQLPELSAIGNYVLRGMTATDTLAIPIATIFGMDVLSVEQGLSLRISERGSFNDSAFTERRDTRVTEFSASLLLSIASHQSIDMPWIVRAGVRTFILSRSGRSTIVNPLLAPFAELERQTQIGPALAISLGRPFGAGPSMRASIWYAVLASKEFDLPSYNRTPQVESYLTAAWAF